MKAEIGEVGDLCGSPCGKCLESGKASHSRRRAYEARSSGLSPSSTILYQEENVAKVWYLPQCTIGQAVFKGPALQRSSFPEILKGALDFLSGEYEGLELFRLLQPCVTQPYAASEPSEALTQLGRSDTASLYVTPERVSIQSENNRENSTDKVVMCAVCLGRPHFSQLALLTFTGHPPCCLQEIAPPYFLSSNWIMHQTLHLPLSSTL